MEKRILYRVYKKTYPTAQTVPGSYDAASKTIVIVMPDDVKHLRFSPSEWKTSGNTKRLKGHLIKVFQWNTGAEANFMIEASETADGGRKLHPRGRYISQTIPGYGPDARDAAIRMAMELAATGKYIRSDDFNPYRL